MGISVSFIPLKKKSFQNKKKTTLGRMQKRIQILKPLLNTQVV